MKAGFLSNMPFGTFHFHKRIVEYAYQNRREGKHHIYMN